MTSQTDSESLSPCSSLTYRSEDHSRVTAHRDSCRFSESFDDNITVDDSQFHIEKNCSTFSRHSFLKISEPLPLLYPIMLPWLRSSSSSFCAVYLFICLSTTWLQIANHTISGAYCVMFTVCHRNYKIKKKIQMITIRIINKCSIHLLIIPHHTWQ